MKETIVEEHRRLEALFAETRAAFRAGSREALRRAIPGLCEALEAHFAQEDRLYYPAVGALRPGYAASLQAFGAGHARFLAQLEEIARRIEQESLAQGEADFEALALAFAAHESSEEELLRSLESEVAATR